MQKGCILTKIKKMVQNLQKKYEISENNLFPLYKNLDMSLKLYPALNMVLQSAHRDY